MISLQKRGKCKKNVSESVVSVSLSEVSVFKATAGKRISDAAEGVCNTRNTIFSLKTATQYQEIMGECFG
jgi:hypothetical protein